MFSKGDAVAIDILMTVHAVIIYLAIVLAGYVVVSIADSFTAREIATRLQVSNAKDIFAEDFILRGGRKFPLYRHSTKRTESVLEIFSFQSQSPPHLSVVLYVLTETNKEAFILYQRSMENQKLSHGHNFHLFDVLLRHGLLLMSELEIFFCWPTNLGWVMGPSILISVFLNGAALALYHGSPLERNFRKFVQDAGVTILGALPSLVKAWKNTNCLEGLDWMRLRSFASTGETSNIDDDLWLSSKAYYKPIIESCGGTKLASSYIQGNPL